MRKLLLSAMIVLGLIIPQQSSATKINILKSKDKKVFQKRTHFLENYFSKPGKPELNKRNGNKLLVLLIEFDDTELFEDNPQTTGNGKFQIDPTDYPITLGKPPHDRDFFLMQLEALKHYYRAASLYSNDGFNEYGFNLEYDIFPQPEVPGVFQAYTLPHEMAYYSPAGASYELMISRFEEYFQDCFTIADGDEDIDFSQFGHFMLIHAGSDWQHDIFGDTPSDMPSFFIKIGEGKEVIVDQGIIIDNSCNIPETITQDIQINNGGDPASVEGYGLINAVMAHEFGHSMGFVDLYNTRNNYPAVGYYDIMDSGGMGGLTLPFDENGEINYDDYQYFYDIEGGLPILPGVWSRLIAWEEDFRDRGILKDFSELNFDEIIEINPAEKKIIPNENIPYFVKLQFNDHEYILIENRQIDPDGDGGTAVQSSPDQRVILYPTPISDTAMDTISYEYDYLLPGWFKATGEAIGGGLVIWHIDEEILYENNNFENNTINQFHDRRAVKIIEADNIEDIGNPYAPPWSWRGTEYDPFYKYSPVLDENGFFVQWDEQFSSTGPIATHNDSLSGITEPPLASNEGNPSIYAVYEISSYSLEENIERVMSFKIGTHLFNHTEKLTECDSITAVGLIGNSYDFPTFPIISETGINFFTLMGGSWFENQFGETLPFHYETESPIFSFNYFEDNYDEKNEYIIVSDKTLNFVTPINTEENPPIELTFSSEISEVPLFLEENSSLVIPTFNKLFIEQDSLEISNARCAFNGSEIVAVSNNYIYFIDPTPPYDFVSIELPETDPDYSPVCYKDNNNPSYDATFIQDALGDVYKIQNNHIERIFSLYPYTSSLPTQLGIGNFIQYDQVHLVFAADDRAFVITLDGTLLPDFPAYIEDKTFKSKSYPKIIKFYNEPIILFEEQNQGYIAIDINANYRQEYSLFWDKLDNSYQFYWDNISERLYFIYSNSNSHLFSSYMENIDENPILWNGYKNGDYSLFTGNINYEIDENVKLSAFAFPNPVKNGEAKIRVRDSKDDIKLKIFDIAGNLIYKKSILKEPNKEQDIPWDTRNIESGVYFGIIKSGKESKKIPIAVEN